MVDLKDVKEAYERTKGFINHTCVQTSRTLNSVTGANVFLKCENFQRTGSFKIRGVINKLLQLQEEEKKKGVVAHSSGNHAQALSYASSVLGLKCGVVMPRNSPKVKVAAVKNYGAEIVECENNVKSRVETCERLIDEHGYVLVHPYDDEQIIAGAGTVAYELINEVKNLDFIFCPVGGGGLLSGTVIAAKGLLSSVKVIGVEPLKADDARRSFKEKKLFPSRYPDTIADGLRTGLSFLTYSIICEHVDDIITVSEHEIVDAMSFVFTRMKMVVEPSGAVSLAGVLRSPCWVKNKNVGVIISGGNVDLSVFLDGWHKKIAEKKNL